MGEMKPALNEIVVIGDVEATDGIRRKSRENPGVWNTSPDNGNYQEVCEMYRGVPRQALKIFLGDIIYTFDIDRSVGPLMQIMKSIYHMSEHEVIQRANHEIGGENNIHNILLKFNELYARMLYILGRGFGLVREATLKDLKQITLVKKHDNSVEITNDHNCYIQETNTICILGNKEIELVYKIITCSKVSTENEITVYMGTDPTKDDPRTLTRDHLKLLYLYINRCVDFIKFDCKGIHLLFAHAPSIITRIQRLLHIESELNICGHTGDVDYKPALNTVILDNTLSYSGRKEYSRLMMEKWKVWRCWHILNTDSLTITLHRKTGPAFSTFDIRRKVFIT